MRFIASTTAMSLYAEAVVVLMGLLIALYWSAVGVLFLMAWLVPVLGVAIFVKLACRVLRQERYGRCLTVTMIVTLLAAFLTRNWFGNQTVLWTVALLTGIASMGAVELLRHITEFLQKRGGAISLPSFTLGQTYKDVVQPGWRHVGFMWRDIFDRIAYRVPLVYQLAPRDRYC